MVLAIQNTGASARIKPTFTEVITPILLNTQHLWTIQALPKIAITLKYHRSNARAHMELRGVGFIDKHLKQHKMKYAFNSLVLLIALGLSSCSTYYFRTGADSNIKIHYDQYVYENDTIQVVYNFWDNGGRMTFTVYNKLNVPIFIDWKNSALIIDDSKYLYWIDGSVTKGLSAGRKSNGTTFSADGSMIVNNERISSIPPQTVIKKVGQRLRTLTSPPKQYTLRFRNYLAFSTKEEGGTNTYIDNRFSVVEVKHYSKVPKINPRDFYTTPK